MFPEDALTRLSDSFLAADHVDRTFLFIVGIAVAFLAIVTALMIYFVIKYSRKRNPQATEIEGNTFLEIVWTVVPTALVIAMFYYGWIGFKTMREVPKNAMTVKVTAQMWLWRFEYANGTQTDVLNVPVGNPVKLELSSLDVVHSLYIPAFRVKEDAVPGADNYMWFQADEEGTYDIFCAEYCGAEHSSMISKVVAMPLEQFREWYNSQGAQDPDPPALEREQPGETGEGPSREADGRSTEPEGETDAPGDEGGSEL
jgi:cytochrome c oxidase subunit 2